LQKKSLLTQAKNNFSHNKQNIYRKKIKIKTKITLINIRNQILRAIMQPNIIKYFTNVLYTCISIRNQNKLRIFSNNSKELFGPNILNLPNNENLNASFALYVLSYAVLRSSDFPFSIDRLFNILRGNTGYFAIDWISRRGILRRRIQLPAAFDLRFINLMHNIP